MPIQSLRAETDTTVVGYGLREIPNCPCSDRRFNDKGYQREQTRDSGDNPDCCLPSLVRFFTADTRPFLLQS